MLRAILRAFLHAEAVVGITLTITALVGSANLSTMTNVLSVVGFVFIGVGVVAVWSGANNRASTIYAESASERSIARRTQDALDESAGRFASLIRWSLVGVFIELTSVLFYFIA
jgi:hypothetical protein